MSILCNERKAKKPLIPQAPGQCNQMSFFILRNRYVSSFLKGTDLSKIFTSQKKKKNIYMHIFNSYYNKRQVHVKIFNLITYYVNRITPFPINPCLNKKYLLLKI